MYRTMISLLALCFFCGVASAETDIGVVYGEDDSIQTDHATDAFIALWVAGTASGPMFGHFIYADGTLLHGFSQFVGTRELSFKGYIVPIFGKVADIWLEGYFGPHKANSGRPTIGHFRISHSESLPRSIVTVDLYDANNLAAPFLTRVAVANNKTAVLISDDAGGPKGASSSNTGLAYCKEFDVTTMQGEGVCSNYRVYSNGFVDYQFFGYPFYFRGSRLRSFQCSNDGFLGKYAEFWVDGYAGSTDFAGSKAYTPGVAHVLVTQASSGSGFEYFYIAVFDPHDLTKPVYQRFGVGRAGQNRILCK